MPLLLEKRPLVRVVGLMVDKEPSEEEEDKEDERRGDFLRAVALVTDAKI